VLSELVDCLWEDSWGARCSAASFECFALLGLGGSRRQSGEIVSRQLAAIIEVALHKAWCARYSDDLQVTRADSKKIQDAIEVIISEVFDLDTAFFRCVVDVHAR